MAKVATKKRLDEPDTSWTDYWRGRSVEERIAMATELRGEVRATRIDATTLAPASN